MLAANQMNEPPLENRFVPQDQDLGHWSSYFEKTPIVRYADDTVLIADSGPELQRIATRVNEAGKEFGITNEREKNYCH